MQAPSFKDTHSEIYTPINHHTSTTSKKASSKGTIASVQLPNSHPQSFPLVSWNDPLGTMAEKQLNNRDGVVSGTYYAMTGAPWLASDARKAVKTDWFWQPIRGQPRRVDTNELRKYANTLWIQSIVMHLTGQIKTIPWEVIPIDEEMSYDKAQDEIETVTNFLEHPNKNNDSLGDLFAAWVKDVVEIDAGVMVKVFTIESYDFEHLEPRSGAPLLKPLICPECMGKGKLPLKSAKLKARRVLNSIVKANTDIPDSYEMKDTEGKVVDYAVTKPKYEPVIEKMLDITTTDEFMGGGVCPFCNGTGKGRQLSEIYVYDGASFLKDSDRTGWVYGYWQYSYAIPAHPMWFSSAEIIYYMMNPRGVNVYGYSAMQSSIDIVKSLEYSVQHNKSLFLDGAVPDGVVSVEDMSDTNLKRMKIAWENELKGQPHKVVFLNKKTTFSPFAFNNREMQFSESQWDSWKQVMTNFQVTAADLGLFEEMNRATAGSATEMGRRKSIRPHLKKIEKLLNDQLLPELGVTKVKFSFVLDDPVEERMNADLNEIYIRSGQRTINECRVQDGLQPVPWGDKDAGDNSTEFLESEEPNEAEGINETIEGEQDGAMDAQEKTSKALIPLGRGKEPPEGAAVIEGPRGGRYYNPNPKETTNKPSKEKPSDNEQSNENPLNQLREQEKEFIEGQLNQRGMSLSSLSFSEKKSDSPKNIFNLLSSEYQKVVKEKMGRQTAQLSDSIPILLVTKKGIEVLDGSHRLAGAIARKEKNLNYFLAYPKKPKTKKDYILPSSSQAPKDVTVRNVSQPYPVAVQRTGPESTKYPFAEIEARCPGCGSTLLAPMKDQVGRVPEGTWYHCRKCDREFSGEELKEEQAVQSRARASREIIDPWTQANPKGNSIEDVLAPAKTRGFNMGPTAPIPNLTTAQRNIRVAPRFTQTKKNVKLKKKVEGLELTQTALVDWVGFEFAPLLSYVQSYLKKYSFAQVKNTRGKIKALRAIFTEAFTTGLNILQLAAEIEDAGFPKDDADRIARTETIRIANEAKLLQAEAKGYTKVQFVATHDAHVCKVCLAYDGKIMTIEQARKLIPLHPNCRCTWRVVVS